MITNITVDGSIILGDEVVCDGYHENKVRIQSHIHSDHMNGFNRSKGEQEIYLTNPSRDLLICQENADLPYRGNIKGVEYNAVVNLNSCTFKMIDSCHMLGAAQIEVVYKNGYRIGYSGDFSWPLDNTIEVDTLILDSTCAGIFKKREFSQEEATYRLIELINSRLNYGPVFIKSHRGTLQRLLDDISRELNTNDIPIVASERACKEINVYKKYGIDLPNIISKVSLEGKKIIKGENRYIELFRPRETPRIQNNSTTINCSRYLDNPKNPVNIHSPTSYTVSISDHADIQGTLEYVKSTGAKKVITDNTRGGKALELAHYIHKELGITAEPSSNLTLY